MRAMILAAGRGERMRPLTDTLPKPLLAVGGKPLIVWHIERLAAAGFTDIVINHAWLGALIEQALGNGARWGVRLHYSAEDSALETAGGIRQALPLLGDAPFLVVNGDIWCDWDPRGAPDLAATLIALPSHAPQGPERLAWLLMVDNPPQHPDGDFELQEDGLVRERGGAAALTFSGIGIYHPALFGALEAGKPARLAPLLVQAMAGRRVAGQRHAGRWVDVGTPQRLAELDASLQ